MSLRQLLNSSSDDPVCRLPSVIKQNAAPVVHAKRGRPVGRDAVGKETVLEPSRGAGRIHVGGQKEIPAAQNGYDHVACIAAGQFGGIIHAALEPQFSHEIQNVLRHRKFLRRNRINGRQFQKQLFQPIVEFRCHRRPDCRAR